MALAHVLKKELVEAVALTLKRTDSMVAVFLSVEHIA